MAQKLIVNLHY